MSYYAFDSTGYLGDVASINGWVQFTAWARQHGTELAALANDGVSHAPAKLTSELRAAHVDSSLPLSVDGTRINLAAIAARASDLLIISDWPNQETDIVTKGDVPGHEFHGNQYTSGMSDATPEEIERISAKYTKWEEALSKEEKLSISRYTGVDYTSMNGVLRGTVPDKPGYVPSDTKQQVDLLNGALLKAGPVEEPFTTYRGVGRTLTKVIAPGATFEDKGFVSTSLTPSSARFFAPLTDGEVERLRTVLRIQVEKGQNGAYIPGGEHEFILPHGVKFEVTGDPEEQRVDGVLIRVFNTRIVQ